MNRLTIAFAGVLAFASFSSEARAYECITGSCPAWCTFPVPYGLTIASPDLGDAATISELQRGFEDWTRVSCTSLTANYTGRSGATAGDSSDGQSVVGWVESGWPSEFGSGAIGVTGPSWDGRNCIRQADMQMNGVNYTWITGSGRGSDVNAYSIILHEAGHYYGLGHSSSSAAAMYFAYQGGIDSLGSDDQNGICSLYPGGSGSDCTTTGCPSGQVCTDGVCMAETGDGSFCSPCSANNHTECGGSGDFCIPYSASQSFCGAACSSSADCPEGGQCVGLSTSTGSTLYQCVGFEGGNPSCAGASTGCTSNSDCGANEICSGGDCVPMPTGGLDLGADCTESTECNSGLCAVAGGRQVCTLPCNDLMPTTACPGGFFCEGGAVCGDGLCVAGAAGATATGGACATDTDCATLLCDRGTCSTPCQVGGATGCAAGFSCQASGSACGACKPEGSVGGLGDPCTTRDDCVTEECALRDGAGFCTNFCDEIRMCPDGFACTPVTDGVSVCTVVEGGGRDDGCGCSVPGASGSSSRHLWLFLIVIPAIVFWRRRRRSRCG